MGEVKPETRAEAVVDELGLLYKDDLDEDDFMLYPGDKSSIKSIYDLVDFWQKSYGGRDAFECLVRTILSQNTSDVASQPAHDALMDRYAGDGDLAETVAEADQQELAETISSAGLHNQKSERIVDIADRIVDEYGGETEFDRFVREDDPETVRDALLDMTGVGPKTADCVLLFAGGREGVFPVDTHVHRIARRIGLAPPDADHEEVRERLEDDVPGEKCGFGHTAMIQFGREYCSARKPACLDDPEACPMADRCDQIGVDPVAGTVTDPAEAGVADD